MHLKNNKVNGWRKIHHAKMNQKKAREAILISDREDFKARKVVRYKVEYHIMIKWSVLQDLSILTMCAPNNTA